MTITIGDAFVPISLAARRTRNMRTYLCSGIQVGKCHVSTALDVGAQALDEDHADTKLFHVNLDLLSTFVIWGHSLLLSCTGRNVSAPDRVRG